MQNTKVKCPRCDSTSLVKDGNYNGEQGYKCKECKKRFSYGKYIFKNNTIKKEEKFYFNDYIDKFKCNSLEERKIATNTARKIAKKKREDIV